MSFPESGDIGFIVVTLVLVIGIILVVIGTITKNRWGLNFDEVNCPSCNRPMPRIRSPRNLSQILWGGGTCENCGCEVDKWGREVISVQNRKRPV